MNLSTVEQVLSVSIPEAIASGAQAALSCAPHLSFLAPSLYFGAEVVVFYRAQDALRRQIASLPLTQKGLNKLPPAVQKVGEWALRGFELSAAIAGAVALNYSSPSLVLRGVVFFSSLALGDSSISKKVVETALRLMTAVQNKILFFQTRKLTQPMTIEYLKTLFEGDVRNLFKTLQLQVPCPNDPHRIPIKGRLESYLDASLVSVPEVETPFIVTQTPMKNTIENFWRMIKDKGVQTIVMLTEIPEGRSEENYVRTKDACKYEFDETTVQLEEYAKSVITPEGSKQEVNFFYFAMTSTKGKELRRPINVYQVANVPDNKTPDLRILKTLISHIEKNKRDTSSTPLVVHCSDGVGRSGVFIEAYSLFKQMEKNATTVNIFQDAVEMRKQRPGMIRTEDQFMDLFHFVIDELPILEINRAKVIGIDEGK